MIYTAIAAAESAGELIRKRFGEPVQVNESTAHDIKIQSDLDSQALIYSIIQARYPDHHLVGEEGDGGAVPVPGGVEWIVDPIDGTVNFAMGIPHFCVSIAARQNGKMLLGVIYDPMRREMFTAEAGQPSLLNGKPIRVSQRSTLGESLMAVGFAKSDASIAHCLSLYQFYGQEAKKLRAMGSAALDLAYVAAGRLDAYIEQGVSLWDIAAGQLLVEQAGGTVEVTPKENGKLKVVATSGRFVYPHT